MEAEASTADQIAENRRSKRRREILAATLRGVRHHGPLVSTAQIAALAKCSKETIYGWFGDRDGLMRALVEEQALAMTALLQAQQPALGEAMTSQLRKQAVLLLDVMTGDAHLAVHQIAVSQDGQKGPRDLGKVVMEQWHIQIVARFSALMQRGVRDGLLVVYSPAEAFEDLVGLLIGDRQRQLLLGINARPAPDQMQAVAGKAVQRWLVLYGA
ncbi:MAG: TetR/AcrR family transcriptional regulator [Pseudomonadota bacterium]